MSDTLGTFTTTANASYGINTLLGKNGSVGGKPRSAGIHTDPAAGNDIGNQVLFRKYVSTSWSSMYSTVPNKRVYPAIYFGQKIHSTRAY